MECYSIPIIYRLQVLLVKMAKPTADLLLKLSAVLEKICWSLVPFQHLKHLKEGSMLLFSQAQFRTQFHILNKFKMP